MIEASDLKISNDSITLVIDQTGIYYRIPIACINEPSKFVENEQIVALKNKKKPDEKTFPVIFFNL
jgi:hypothetical protein